MGCIWPAGRMVCIPRTLVYSLLGFPRLVPILRWVHGGVKIFLCNFESFWTMSKKRESSLGCVDENERVISDLSNFGCV